MARTAAPTFAAFANEFLTEYAPVKFSPRHVQNYKSLYDRWLIPAFGEYSLNSITEPMVNKFLLKMATQTGPVNVSHAYHCFQRTMKTAAKVYGYIPAWTLQVEGVGGDRSKKRPELSLAEAEKIIMLLPDPYADAARVAIGASLRIGEVCGLNRSDWHSEDRRLDIVRQYQDGQLKEPKMGSAGSVWPLNDAAKILDSLTADPPKWAHKDDALFRGAHGARLHPVLFRNAWSTARGQHFKELHVHDLRAVGLTEYARRPGVTLQDLMDHGRHKDVKSAMRYQKGSDAERRRSLSEDAA